MMSAVAKIFAKVFNEWYQPVNSSITNNMFTPTQNRQDVRQYTVKGDHTLGEKQSSRLMMQARFPANFQENVSEVWSLKDPDLGGPLSRSIRQQRRGYNWNIGYDLMASPSILSHTTAGLNNNGNAFRSRQVGKSFADPGASRASVSAPPTSRSRGP